MGKVYKQLLDFQKKYGGSVSWRNIKHCKVIETHLNPKEEVLFVFSAQKNDHFYDLFTTYVFALTNKRILLARKRLLWGYFLISITPDLFNDLKVYSGLIWGKVIIDTVKEVVVFSNVSKKGLNEIETNVTEFMMTEKKKYGIDN